MAEFDEALKSRLLAFQRAHGLAEDALVGAKTWTKLVEDAGTSSMNKQERQVESASEAPTAGTDGATAHAATITPENFPLLFAVAEKCRDENGMTNFLRDEIGVDVGAILADMDRVLDADSQEVSAQ